MLLLFGAGVISSYGLWMDGTLRQNSSLTSFGIVGLSPWSLHSFRVQACTSQGCALGPLVRARPIYIMLNTQMCQMAARHHKGDRFAQFNKAPSARA